MFKTAITAALIFFGLASSATAADPVHHSFSVQVFSVDPGITEIAPNDFFEIAYTIDQSIADQNNSIGAGTFPALATALSLAARPLNALPWHPMGTFDLAGGNYVTNAFGDNFTFQVKGSGFPNGGPGLTFLDLDLSWSWPANLTDSGQGDTFAQQFGGTFNPARTVLRPSSIRFLAGSSSIREAVFVPETPTLAGDYNVNGIVDAADYTVWRDLLAPGPGILANDATPGTISSADYDTWRTHFGQTGGSGAGVGAYRNVPEPPTLAMLLVGMPALFICRRWPRCKPVRPRHVSKFDRFLTSRVPLTSPVFSLL